jgi:hypothetical protein
MDPLTFAKLWMLVKPIQRIRLARARRRARKAGEPEPLTIPEENAVFPQGTMTKSGIVIQILGPILTVGLMLYGVGSCTPDQVAQGCQSAAELGNQFAVALGGLVTAGGDRLERQEPIRSP